MENQPEALYLLPKEIGSLPSSLHQINSKFEWITSTVNTLLSSILNSPLHTIRKEDAATIRSYLWFLRSMHCSTSHFTSPEQNEDHVLAEQNWIQAMHQLHQSEWDQQDTKVPFDMSNIYLHVNYIRLNVINILDTLGPMTIPPSMDTRWVYFNHLRRILATQCAMTHQHIPILDPRLETHLDLKYAVVGRRLSSFIRYYSQWFM